MLLSTLVPVALLASAPFAVAAPFPGDGGSAYSGAGGNASGGGVTYAGDSARPDQDHNLLGALNLGHHDDDDNLIDAILRRRALVNLFSGNAGDGGDASSGEAHGGQGGNTNGVDGAGGNGGNVYSGAGGNAAGGNVVHNGDEGLELISLFSDNAGNGGKATSGYAYAGNGGDDHA
ncbi:hypothetical protein FRC04_010773 [Tulasnella sp. 424]|nr:hypothetical protein FRC04_010773 [Tulasnella sp. 424]KAG8969298.1 hypothetical protein FRC05_001158 [Tulasnella sp. 425]